MRTRFRRAALACASLALAACGLTPALVPVHDPGGARVRAELAALEADPALAGRAPEAMKEAQDAVQAAEAGQSDADLARHLVYLADRKVQTARALAEAEVAQDRLNTLREQQGLAAPR